MNVSATADALQHWLLTTGSNFGDEHLFVDAYSHELRSQGIPVDRVWLSANVLHPLVAARAWKWEYPGKITDSSWSKKEYRQFQEDMVDLGASRSQYLQYIIFLDTLLPSIIPFASQLSFNF
jgi:hypothetical protein